MALGPVARLVEEIAEHMHGGGGFEAVAEQGKRGLALLAAWTGLLGEGVGDDPRGLASLAAQAPDCLK